jgi:hypothetical protein
MVRYHQPTLSNLRVEHDYYTTRQAAELFHVTPTTIITWIKKGYLQAEMHEPITKGAKTQRGQWRIFPQSIEDDISVYRDELIELSKRYWPRLLDEIKKR